MPVIFRLKFVYRHYSKKTCERRLQVFVMCLSNEWDACPRRFFEVLLFSDLYHVKVCVGNKVMYSCQF